MVSMILEMWHDRRSSQEGASQDKIGYTRSVHSVLEHVEPLLMQDCAPFKTFQQPVSSHSGAVTPSFNRDTAQRLVRFDSAATAMKKHAKPSQTDINLFRAAVGKVQAVKHDRSEQSPPKPAPEPIKTHADEQQVMHDALSDEWLGDDLKPEDSLQFSVPGLQPKILKKLKRGEIRREAELDLHGLTVDAARRSIVALLHEAQQQQWRCLRVIHGKGLRSGSDGPLLKTRLNSWLRQRQEVLAFCSAPPRDGGNGAVYILLKRHSSV